MYQTRKTDAKKSVSHAQGQKTVRTKGARDDRGKNKAFSNLKVPFLNHPIHGSSLRREKTFDELPAKSPPHMAALRREKTTLEKPNLGGSAMMYPTPIRFAMMDKNNKSNNSKIVGYSGSKNIVSSNVTNSSGESRSKSDVSSNITGSSIGKHKTNEVVLRHPSRDCTPIGRASSLRRETCARNTENGLIRTASKRNSDSLRRSAQQTIKRNSLTEVSPRNKRNSDPLALGNAFNVANFMAIFGIGRNHHHQILETSQQEDDKQFKRQRSFFRTPKKIANTHANESAKGAIVDSRMRSNRSSSRDKETILPTPFREANTRSASNTPSRSPSKSPSISSEKTVLNTTFYTDETKSSLAKRVNHSNTVSNAGKLNQAATKIMTPFEYQAKLNISFSTPNSPATNKADTFNEYVNISHYDSVQKIAVKNQTRRRFFKSTKSSAPPRTNDTRNITLSLEQR
ncbi:hypothetical protein SK128_017854 [Halocaridina rubra]|uniref:Uncharacterized protein n=1 Tax=Halocaridina rubra TaxID=373956 RepID=A0AAN9ABP1_HALRR